MKFGLPKRKNANQDSEPERGLRYQAVTGLFWLLTGNAVFTIVRMLVLVILARLLTPEDYGVVGAAMVIVSFAQLFSELGVGPALIQHPNLEERHLRTSFTIFTSSGLLMGILITLAAPLIASFFQIDGLVTVIRVSAVVFPLQAFTSVPLALLRRDLQFRTIAWTNVATYIGGFGLVGIGMALSGFGVWALIGALISRLLINIVLLLIIQPFPKRPQFERQAFRELIHYGGGFTIARLFNYGATQGDNMIVGRWLGAEALGFYGRAYQLLVVPANLFGDIIDQVMFPSMAKIQHSREKLGEAYRQAISLTALIYLPLSAALVILAPELIQVALGSQWTAVKVPFQILAVGMLFRASKVNNVVPRATGHEYKRAWRQGVYAFLVFSGAFVGKNWGLSGVASGVLFALFVNFLLMVQLCLSLTGVSLYEFLKGLLPSLLMAGITLVLTQLVALGLRSLNLPALAILIGAGIVVGGCLLVLLRLLPRVLLGQDGMWMLEVLWKQINKKLKFMRPVKQVSSPLDS